ncbi:MAG: glycoside hydrolase family 3 C-terminal domain-containing protein [Bacteroidales bacterium]|nr:glycoside hydrolase family 3 C-terminal domain-containing protein [Bacteroidales bacterium]
MKLKLSGLLGLLLLLTVLIQSCKQNIIYKDPNAGIEERVEDLLKRMTLEEKLEQLAGTGTTGFDTKINYRLGIPAFRMSDGPLGVRWEKATAFPCGAAIAATWDTTLVIRFAEALASETKARGRNYLLGPCVNIHRFPIGGRNFESYGEDPWLASRMAVNYVKALQSRHIIPSIKHFALNNQEWRRTEINVVAEERAMREIYLPSFEAAVKEANVWTVMSAYNKVNGFWCSENKQLLTDILKNDWGFKGLVVSDWVSTHSTELAANNGLDIEMPVGDVFAIKKLKKAIKEGKIQESAIDDKVRRILRVKFLAGLFDQKRQKADTTSLVGESHKKLALDLALESTVLLKNKGNLLPLEIGKYKKIAVIGPNAAEARTGGGGSSMVKPFYSVSALDGIRKLVGNTSEVVYAQGDVIVSTPLEAIPSKYLKSSSPSIEGLKAEYFKNMDLSGKPVVTRTDKNMFFDWGDAAPDPSVGNEKYSVRWTGTVTPPVTRKYAFYTAGDDGARLFVNGKKLIENWTNHGVTVDTGYIELEAGKPYEIRAEYYEDGGSAVFILGWDQPEDKGENKLLAEAVRIAKESDVAIVCVGSSENIESEGFDRRDGLNLAGNQAELIKAVSEVNPRTIVVLNTGTAVITSPWLNQVPAVLEAFFPGQEGGNALAQILFGKHNPSGKLPFSFIAGPEQTPSFQGYMNPTLEAPYSEGIFVGYRFLEKNKMVPVFPFGHGLSYSSFGYSGIRTEKMEDGTLKVYLKVKNTGKVAGAEVVQLYVSDKHSKVARPEKELKGFAKVYLEPGEEKEVSFILNSRSFAYYDVPSKAWKVEPGIFKLLAGSSASDIRQQIDADIK